MNNPRRSRLQWPRTATLVIVTLGSIAAAAIAAAGEPEEASVVALADALVPSAAACAQDALDAASSDQLMPAVHPVRVD
ncbi:MAG TPA: hypothetical protein VN680_09040 [Burkholderiaceae bacterium]|jgi:hypothetical protein|nr:hypothetical protein [Burkholderiaceae bacterium]